MAVLFSQCMVWAAVGQVVQAGTKPHILMIVMDDLGSSDLGVHGSGIATPVIDKLLGEGVYLNSYYVLPSCSPTRSALMSGRYPLHTGINNFIPQGATYGLAPDEETIPQMLSNVGYKRYAVGKWHLGHAKWDLTPTFRGFESFFGFYYGGEDYFNHMHSGAYDLRWDKKEKCGAGCSQVADELGNYSTHVFTREAVRVIEQYNSTDPLFLYLAYQAVHAPDEVPESYKAPYANRTDWNEKRKTYAGMLRAADEGIGNVTAALKAAGMWEDLIIVFTTDNGGPSETCAVQGSSNFPRRGGKCSIWEGGTHGDSFIWGLNDVKAGELSHLFHAVDWLPTIAELVKAKPNGKALDGVSQLGALNGKDAARTEVYYGITDSQVGIHGPALRMGKWKLIEGTGGLPGGWPRPGNSSEVHVDQSEILKPKPPTYLLFDLVADPHEREDVAANNKEVVNMLVDRINRYKATGVPQAANDPKCAPKPPAAIDPRVGKVWEPWCSTPYDGSEWVGLYERSDDGPAIFA